MVYNLLQHTPPNDPQQLIEWMRSLQMVGSPAGSQLMGSPPQEQAMPTPPPQGQQAPQPQGPGILDRIANALYPVPQGMLTPEEQKMYTQRALLEFGSRLSQAGGPHAVRPTLMGAIGEAISGGSPEMQQLAGGLEQRRMEQDKESQRKAIFDKYPAKDNESIQDRGKRLMNIFNELVRIGDTEMAGKVSEVLKSMGLGDSAKPKFGYMDAGDRLILTQDGQPMYNADGTPMSIPKGRTPESVASERNQERQDARLRLQASNQLTNQYLQTTRQWITGKQAIGRALQFTDEALKPGNAPAQQQFLWAFVATLDNSVVREGEVQMLGGAAAWKDRAMKALGRIARQQMLDPVTIRNMVEILKRVDTDFDNRFRYLRKQYQDRGSQWGVNPDDFLDLVELMKMGGDAGGGEGSDAAGLDALEAQYGGQTQMGPQMQNGFAVPVPNQPFMLPSDTTNGSLFRMP